jgi:hypothetical protein
MRELLEIGLDNVLLTLSPHGEMPVEQSAIERQLFSVRAGGRGIRLSTVMLKIGKADPQIAIKRTTRSAAATRAMCCCSCAGPNSVPLLLQSALVCSPQALSKSPASNPFSGAGYRGAYIVSSPKL